MPGDFNPYTEWFGIPADEQPPDHYRLLGLTRFESDASRIDEASEKRANFLQDVANGPHTKHSQQLLNQVATARLCLISDDARREYDEQLRQADAAPAGKSRSELRKRLWAKSSGLEAGGAAAKGSSAETASTSDSAILDEFGSMEEPGGKSKKGATKHDRGKPAAVAPNSPQTDKFAISTASEDSGRRSTVGTSKSRSAGKKSSHYGRKSAKKPVAGKAMLVAGGILATALMMLVVFMATRAGEAPRVEDGSAQSVSTAISPPQDDKKTRSAERNASKRSGLATSSLDPTASPSPSPSPSPSVSKSPSQRTSTPKQPVTPAKHSGGNDSDVQLPPKVEMPDISDEAVPREGLVLWLDAADKSTFDLDEFRVTSWRDKSDNGFYAVQKDVNHAPFRWDKAVDGRPGVRFSTPKKHFLEISHAPPLNLGDLYTIVTVAKMASGVMISKGLPHRNQPGAFSIFRNASNFRHSAEMKMTVSSGENQQDSMRFRVRTLVADADSLTWYVDQFDGIPQKSPHTIENDDPLLLGKRKQSPTYADSVIAELLIYNRPLEDEERSELGKYLKSRWIGD